MSELFDSVAKGAKKKAKVTFGIERDDEGHPKPVVKSGTPAPARKWKHTITERDDNGCIKEIVSEVVE